MVILSRQIVNAVREPMRGARLRPPAPPGADRVAARAAEPTRRSADPTDYNVQIASAYAAPLLGEAGSIEPQATSLDASWEAEMELLTKSKTRSLAIFIASGVAVVFLVVAASYWL